MFECRSKHIYNESLGGKRSPDFSNRKSDKTMKKFLEIMMIVFCPYIVIYRQKRQIRLLKSDMNYASKFWSIEKDPKSVDYDWIVRNAFHVKPIFSLCAKNKRS